MFGNVNLTDYVCFVVRVNDVKTKLKYKIMNATIANRVNAKSTNTKTNVKPVNGVAEVDENSIATGRQTYALYQANRAASKVNGCEIYNDWHKQGLTVKEVNELLAEYNKVTGYVYTPKKKEAKVKEVATVSEGVKETVKTKSRTKTITQNSNKTEPQTNVTASHAAKIAALKEMRKEGLLTVAELTEALNGLV